MSYKYEGTRRRDSVECPGVTFVLKRMTEGRRLDLRKKLQPTASQIRDILRDQARLLERPKEDQDLNRIMELQDQYDELTLTIINPETLLWGVKQIEGLEVDGKTLTLEDWRDWPSQLFSEVLEAVNDESQLNGADAKNSPSPTTSGPSEGGSSENTTAAIAGRSGDI